MNKQATHPSGLTVTFYEDNHTYIIDQAYKYKLLESATTFISKFFPKFETDNVAKKCAGKGKYKGMTVDEIKQAWADEALRGSTEGTNTHMFAECLSNGDLNALPEPQSERESKLFDQVAVAILMLEEKFIFIEAEKIVFSPELGLAGTIDLLMFDPAKNHLIILDWKQNKKIDSSNSWESAMVPIKTWDACDLNKYKLQLNLYEFILRREDYFGFDNIPKVSGVRKALIHLTEDTFRAIPIGYYQDTINQMLSSQM